MGNLASGNCKPSYFQSLRSLGGGKALFHLLAFIAVSIWGVTFVLTKILINSRLSPLDIFICRFTIAYVCIIAVAHKRLWADSIKDEALMCVAGLSGGSLYFVAENSALGITYASNVSLIICTAPIFTMLLGKALLGIPLRRKMFVGSIVALVGVGLVVFNGAVNLGINPLGDLLTLAAAILWALYCIVLKIIGDRYPVFFVTRKVFFYGVLSAVIIYLFDPSPVDVAILQNPVVFGNLMFLGIAASMLCYVLWSGVVKVLGAEKAANYIYCVPLMTILTAVAILDEPLTVATVAGAFLIISGVYLAEK